jgi:GAF domain-containing protein
MTDPRITEHSDAFAELGRIDFSKTDVATALTKVADVARRNVPGADDVSITLVGPEGAHTAAFTGPLAITVDEWQYQQGHGPCLAASAANITVSVPDLAGDGRWPDWAGRAVDAGVHSSLSVGLPMHDSVSGALNVYAREPHAFDPDAVVLTQTFAGFAVVAMANAHLYDGYAALAGHTRAVLDGRAVIELAKGMIMAERRCTADEAFAVLTKLAEYSHRDLRDVAAGLTSAAHAGTADPSPRIRPQR